MQLNRIRAVLAIHGLFFKDTYFVAKGPLKLNYGKHLLNKPEHYFELFLTIKYLRVFNM